jgi:hypothetical protein
MVLRYMGDDSLPHSFFEAEAPTALRPSPVVRARVISTSPVVWVAADVRLGLKAPSSFERVKRLRTGPHAPVHQCRAKVTAALLLLHYSSRSCEP